MIEAVRKQGEPIARQPQQRQADALVVQVAQVTDSSKPEQYVILLNFDLSQKALSLELEPLTVDSSYDYFHIGTADGPNSEQWMLTGTRPDYIVSQAITALVKRMPADNKWREPLEQVRQHFFYDTGEKKGMQARYRYVLDVQHFTGVHSDVSMNTLLEEAGEGNGKEKKLISLVVKTLNEAVSKQLEVKAKDVALWVLTINGELPQQDDAYRQLAWQLKEAAFEKAKQGICSMCNAETTVSPETSKLKFKSYITDKISFASGLSKDFSRNFQLCRQCHRELILGEMRIMGNYRARIGRLPLYIIPEFLFDNDGKYALEKSDEAVNQGRAILDMETAEAMGKNLLEDMWNEEQDGQLVNPFTLHFLFYLKQQSEFRVMKLIKDVAPSRIIALQRVTRKVDQLRKQFFLSWNEEEKIKWVIDFAQIYWLFPLREKKGQLIEYRKLLQLYDAILMEKRVERREVVGKLLELAKVYRLEQTEAYQLSTPKGSGDYAMVVGLLKGMLLLKYLEEAHVLRGGEGMDVSQLSVNDDLKNFIGQMGYSETQTALITLGLLINNVAYAQYREGHKTKPILDKLSFQGMNIGKLQRLSNDVFAKLKQYKLMFPDNERLFADHTMFLHKNRDAWDLSDQDNVFYVLSGYALGTRRFGKQAEEE